MIWFARFVRPSTDRVQRLFEKYAGFARIWPGPLIIDFHVQNLQDLYSRYKFAPMTTENMPFGEQIAGHLDRHLSRFGPPLFLKRDNGGNLNHFAVNTILEELIIIPINSPCYRVSYNGAIEHSQGELKFSIGKCKAASKTNSELALLVEKTSHELNHHLRRSVQITLSNRQSGASQPGNGWNDTT